MLYAIEAACAPCNHLCFIDFFMSTTEKRWILTRFHSLRAVTCYGFRFLLASISLARASFFVQSLFSSVSYSILCFCCVLLNVQSVKMLTDYSLNELRTMDFLDSKKHGSFFIMFYIRCDRWIEWNPFFMISHIVNYNKFIGCNPFWLGASKKKDQSNEAMKLMLDWWWKRKDFWSYVIKCNSKIGFSAHSLVEGVKQLIELCLMIVRQKKNQIVSKCKATQQRYQQCFQFFFSPIIKL